MFHSEPPMRQRLDHADVQGAFALASQPTRVIGLTVVAGGLDACAAFALKAGVALELAGRDLQCPLQLAYPDPSQLGVDRWVGAVAARERYGTAVVVDCGTALTVNLVTADGVFHGGAIAPGPYTMAHALADYAPALPVVDLQAAADLPATDSTTAVNAGVGLGFCGMVDALVTACVQAVGVEDATLVITGGGAQVYERFGSRPHQLEPDLIHQGLRWLALEPRPANF
jgi:type III pantothenate kinase